MAGPERFRLIPEAHLFIVRDGTTLLLRRANTGYEDGNYGVVAGHIEGGESARAATCREALEEAGLRIAPADLRFAHVVHRTTRGERISLFFEAVRHCGEPTNREPEKCDHLGWFPLDRLPDNMVPYVRRALELWQAGVPYSEDGFD